MIPGMALNAHYVFNKAIGEHVIKSISGAFNTSGAGVWVTVWQQIPRIELFLAEVDRPHPKNIILQSVRQQL